MINAINISPVTATVCSYDLISFTVFTRAISRGGGRSAVKRTHIGRGGCTTILAITVNTWAVAKKSLGLIKCVIRCLDSVEVNNNIDNKLPQSRVTKRVSVLPSSHSVSFFRRSLHRLQPDLIQRGGVLRSLAARLTTSSCARPCWRPRDRETPPWGDRRSPIMSGTVVQTF